MLSDLVSMEVLLKLSSEVQTFLTFSNIAGVVAIISLFKSFPTFGKANAATWLVTGVAALCTSAGLVQLAEKKAFSDLSKDEIVVDKSFFTKEKYLKLDSRTISVASTCLELGFKCSEANRKTIFGSVDKDVIDALKTNFSIFSKNEKLALRLEKVVESKGLALKDKPKL